MVGLDIPIRPSRRHLFVTEPMSFPRRSLPMVVDFHNGFWFRREGSCLIFGMRAPLEPEGFSTSVDWGFFADILAPAALQRLPQLKETGIMRGQAGLHADTPDCMAILGEAPGVAGLYLACGFSGHGFMHSPAVGRLMAELIVKGESSLPEADTLSLDRFQKPVQAVESAYI
jgi:sarcosine oxidase subunit beta